MKNREIDEIKKQVRKDFYVRMTSAVVGVIVLLIALTTLCR